MTPAWGQYVRMRRGSPAFVRSAYRLGADVADCSPGGWVSPSHHRPLKDSGREVSLTVVLTLCMTEKDLSVLSWPLWLRGANSNKSLLLSVSAAAVTWRSAETRAAERGGAVFTGGFLTVNRGRALGRR